MTEELENMTLKQLAELRDKLIEERKALNYQVLQCTSEIDTVDQQIIKAMEEVGDAATINGKRYAPQDVLVPKVESWDDLYSWILENQALYLLQRRVSSTAYRDLLDSGEGPDGIVPETIRKLSVRKV